MVQLLHMLRQPETWEISLVSVGAQWAIKGILCSHIVWFMTFVVRHLLYHSPTFFSLYVRSNKVKKYT